MPRVFIPPLARSLTGGVDQLEVEGRSVREVVEELERRFPGIRGRLCDEKGLKPGLTVAVDSHVSSLGLVQKLTENSEVHFLPAIGGG